MESFKIPGNCYEIDNKFNRVLNLLPEKGRRFFYIGNIRKPIKKHLKKAKAKAEAIRFSTTEAICEILECQSVDILEFVPDKKE